MAQFFIETLIWLSISTNIPLGSLLTRAPLQVNMVCCVPSHSTQN